MTTIRNGKRGNCPHGSVSPALLGVAGDKLLSHDGDASQQKRTLHITGSRREDVVEVTVVCSYDFVCCFRRGRRSPRAPDGFADSVETRHPRFRTVKKGVLLRQRVHQWSVDSLFSTGPVYWSSPQTTPRKMLLLAFLLPCATSCLPFAPSA